MFSIYVRYIYIHHSCIQIKYIAPSFIKNEDYFVEASTEKVMEAHSLRFYHTIGSGTHRTKAFNHQNHRGKIAPDKNPIT